MTTTLTTSTRAGTGRPRSASRGWALAGLGAGIAGITSIVASGATDAVYDEELAGDAEAVARGMSEQITQIMVFHTATMVSCVLLLVFAAGLHRQLRTRTGTDSLVPGVAVGGLMLVAVAQLMGSALTTEFVFAFQNGLLDMVVPEVVAFFGHWVNTVPWLWGGAGITAVALASAVFRERTHARWIGWTSATLGGLTALFLVSPLQYMAGMTGPLWLTIVSAGLVLSRRERTGDTP